VGDLNGTAGIARGDKVGALDDTASGHVETGDDAFGETQGGFLVYFV
jgi:hypothetical protein